MTYAYNGVTLKEYVRTHPVTCHALADIFYQVLWTLTVAATKANLTHGDVHINNILVQPLRHPARRRYAVWTMEGDRLLVEYSSTIKASVPDWALASPFIPYQR